MIPEAKVKTGKYISWRSNVPMKIKSFFSSVGKSIQHIWYHYWPIFMVGALFAAIIVMFALMFRDCEQQAKDKRSKAQDMADSYTKHLGLEGQCRGKCGNNQEDYIVCCTYFLPEQKVIKFRCHESDCSIEQASIEVKK